jgi:hypothetical protein
MDGSAGVNRGGGAEVIEARNAPRRLRERSRMSRAERGFENAAARTILTSDAWQSPASPILAARRMSLNVTAFVAPAERHPSRAARPRRFPNSLSKSIV